MDQENQGFFGCRNICWIIGALFGLTAFLLLSGRVGLGTFMSVILALVIMVGLALFLQRFFCSMQGMHNENASHRNDVAASSEGVSRVDQVGQAELASAPKVPERSRPVAASAPVAEPTPEPAPEPAPAAEPTPEPAAAAGAETTPDYDGDGIHEGTGEGTRPAALDGPRGSSADDLKQIKGVGPKLESVLNSLGFYHFDQVAGWSSDEVAWVDANLTGFKGRVSRDNWVEQAKLLAAGVETEFSKRVSKGEVYD